MLAGRYRLEPDGTVVAVGVRLEGSLDGYIIRECRVLTDAEFHQFEIDLEAWNSALREYYAVYSD